MQAALPYGGTRPGDVRRMLEVCREGKGSKPTSNHANSVASVRHPHLFARELAYVIECCSTGTEEDVRNIVLLYLEGARSLPLAVAYTQKNHMHSSMLWELLVSYCIKSKSSNTETYNGNNEKANAEDGSLFGSLLEVAARCGADLSKLVLKIPKGMRIEGLRPKLVAAIADYRLKLKINEAAAEILLKDKVSLLREFSHRSRRGVRVMPAVQKSGVSHSARAGAVASSRR